MRKILVIAVIAFLAVSCCLNSEQTMDTKKAVIDNIMSRTSVRSYTSQPIDDEQIETMLRAAMAAPTGRNLQPWAFVVVNERESMDFLCEKLPYAKMLKEAPLAIIVCGDTTKAADDSNGHNLWEMDCSAATQNLLLAANALGLGAVWTAGFPYTERMDAIREAVNLPRHLIPLCVVPIGYPNEPLKPKDKWKPENVHYNRFK